MNNETKVGEDLINVIVEQQHKILGSQENIHKARRTKILDFKKVQFKEYEIY